MGFMESGISRNARAAMAAGAEVVARAYERREFEAAWRQMVMLAAMDAMVITTLKRRAVTYVEIKQALKTCCSE